MTARFSVGDCVELIVGGPITCEGAYHLGGKAPKPKIPLRVLSTFPSPTGCGCVVVLVSGGRGGVAQRFRKIDDEVTEDFRAQLRSLKTPQPANRSTLAGPLAAPSSVSAPASRGDG